MELIGLILALIGVIALIASAIILIISVVKNTNTKLVSGLMLLTSFVLVAMGGVAMQLADDDKQSTPEKEKQDVVAEGEEVISKDEVVEVYSVDAKEIEYYQMHLVAKIDRAIMDLDNGWESLWAATFKSISEDITNLNEANEKLEKLKRDYRDLGVRVSGISADKKKMSEENHELFEGSIEALSYAIAHRGIAIDVAIASINNEGFSPSDTDKINEAIELSDLAVIDMAAKKFQLENNYGLIPKE